ncbi:MAG: hypothetical protein WAQ27_00795 [Candidatus Microsaccharimonas sp.]
MSSLDQILLDFDPIKFNRSFYGVQTRSGKHVVYKNVAFDMQHTSIDHIQLNAPYGSKAIVTRSDGFTMNMRGNKRMTVSYLKELARALYKIGLGLVYLDLGAEIAYSARFDEVRKIILGESDFNGYLAIAKKPALEHTATVLHWDKVVEGRPLSFFRFYYYGVDIFYDIEYRAIELPDEFPTDQINLIRF